MKLLCPFSVTRSASAGTVLSWTTLRPRASVLGFKPLMNSGVSLTRFTAMSCAPAIRIPPEGSAERAAGCLLCPAAPQTHDKQRDSREQCWSGRYARGCSGVQALEALLKTGESLGRIGEQLHQAAIKPTRPPTFPCCKPAPTPPVRAKVSVKRIAACVPNACSPS